MSEDVQETYAEIATTDGPEACCEEAGVYEPERLAAVPDEAELGLGTGDPVGEADPQPGETVVDLGSGSGVDVFLAADAVGPEGEAIGVDLTAEMVERARRLADEHGIENAAFHHGRIEELPLPDGVADVVVSNCVVNLSEDKPAVLSEAFRVLAPGGRLVVSDTVRIGEGEPGCGCACQEGALTAAEWKALLQEAGFEAVAIDPEPPDGRFGPEVGTGLVRARKPR